MGAGVIRLFRSPLKEGETLFTLSNIDQGRYTDGVHKDEKKPKRQSVFPQILEDGRLCWEMLDSEANRKFCEAHLPTSENPPFVYSVELPEDLVPETEEVEVETEVEPIKKRGRKPKVNPKAD